MAGERKRTEYKLNIRDTAGVKQAVVTDYLKLAYTKRVNEPGLLQVLFEGDHALASLLEHKWQVEVLRRNQHAGIDWYVDFYGMVMKQDMIYTDQSYFGITCPGQATQLNWRWVMWKAGTANRSRFVGVAAETIMKTLASYNLASAATVANGREREGALTGLSVEADGGGGNSLNWSCAWKRVLGELQGVARVAGGDFDLVKTGGATWEFRWYAGQRGDDLTGDVTFSLGRGNMANPRYVYDRIGEATAAVVGGRGAESAREISVRTGADYGAANDVETFVDARQTDSAAGREAAGDRRLDQVRAREMLMFDVLQTDSTVYGRDYCIEGQMGDVVRGRFMGRDWNQKVVGVTVANVRGGGDEIGVEMETQ